MISIYLDYRPDINCCEPWDVHSSSSDCYGAVTLERKGREGIVRKTAALIIIAALPLSIYVLPHSIPIP